MRCPYVLSKAVLSNAVALCCVLCWAALFPAVHTVGAGETIPGLYNASEALRLASSLFALMSPERAEPIIDMAQLSALPPSAPGPSTESFPGSPEEEQDPSLSQDTAGQGVVVGLDGVGYWQVTWLYLTSLLKLGEVYEVAGSHEDAVHAFREGQELVSRSCIVSTGMLGS